MIFNKHTDRTRKYRALSVSILFFLTFANLATAAIVFKSNRGWFSIGDIYVMNDDGSNVKKLTDTRLFNTYPRWSPDGTQIVFIRDLRKLTGNNQRFEMFLMDADGRNERRLTYSGSNITPNWSPDGTQIVYSRNQVIRVMDIASGVSRPLSQNGEAWGYDPHWSPDGQQILHSQYGEGDDGRQVYVTDADGEATRPFLQQEAHPHRPPDVRASQYDPQWSPDGQQVVYLEVHDRSEPTGLVHLARYIVIVDKHGRNPQILDIPERWRLRSVCWAADGREVLFTRSRVNLLAPPTFIRDGYDIYRYTLSSGEITQLTENSNYDNTTPHWTPHALSVIPAGKLTTLWGDLKARD